VFSLFPAASGDLFGRKYATTNYGLLYTAKGTASLLILLGNRVQEQHGWGPVFALMIAFDWVAAFLALVVLPRVRRRHSEDVGGSAVVVASHAEPAAALTPPPTADPPAPRPRA
jgi:OFA family oxalate/formate antiporter-like MFS transporter